MVCDNCKHPMWDHEFIEEVNDDTLTFGKCEMITCDCEEYVEK